MKETNKEFSKTNNTFIDACTLADIKATPRQASKFKSQKGLAWKTLEKTTK